MTFLNAVDDGITHLVIDGCHEGGVAFNIPLPQQGEEGRGVLGEQQAQLLQTEGHYGGGHRGGRRWWGRGVTLALVTGPGGWIWGFWKKQ